MLSDGSFSCSLAELQPVTLAVVNKTEDERLWDELIKEHHYLGFKAMIGQYIKYLAWSEDRPLAALSFNRAALRVGVRDSYIGWNEEGRKEYLKYVVSNHRYLIMPWLKVKNMASHILGLSLRGLKEDWRRLYGYEPLLVETFVDSEHYKGTCYLASNWVLLGETKGFGKQGRTFEFHGHKKKVFLYELDKGFIRSLPPHLRRTPKTEAWESVLPQIATVGYHKDILADANVTLANVNTIDQMLFTFMSHFSPVFHNIQIRNATCYAKGLCGEIQRKSMEGLAVPFMKDYPGTARSIQNFITNSRWDLDYLKRLYVKLVIDEIGVPGGAFIFDDADEKKSGYWSPGTGAQFDGPDGQTARALAAQVLQYFGGEGLGWALVDIRLYLPKYWFPAGPAELADPDESAKYAKFAAKRKARRIPEEIVFRAKNQICSDMLIKAYNEGVFPAKWALFGAFLGHEKAFIDSIPKELFYFGGAHCDDKFYTETPTFPIPEKKKGGGRNPKNMAPSFSPLKAEEIVANDPTPWRMVEFGLGLNGPLPWEEKLIRVLEIREDKPGGRIWLYAKKFENGAIEYQISNAPEDTPLEEIRKVSTLRRAIEQNFKECKSELGMDQFEGRTWDGWHRHMTLTMLTHFFLLLLRKVFSVNIEDLSEKGRKTYEYLPSVGRDRVVKDGPLSQVFRAMIEDKSQCQDQGQGQDDDVDDNDNDNDNQDQGQGTDQGYGADQG